MPSPHLSYELRPLRVQAQATTPGPVAHTACLALAPGLTADCYQTRLGTAWIIDAPHVDTRFATTRAINLFFVRRKHYQQLDSTHTYRRWAREVAQRHRPPSPRFLGACRIVLDWLES